MATARHHAVGRARQRVHAPADAGGARRADLAGVDGALAAPVGPRRRSPRRRAAGLGKARLSAARAAAARGGAGRSPSGTATSSPSDVDALRGLARRRLVHRPCGGRVRLRSALPRGRHERPAGGRPGGARRRATPARPASAPISPTSTPCCRPTTPAAAARLDRADGAGRAWCARPARRAAAICPVRAVCAWQLAGPPRVHRSAPAGAGASPAPTGRSAAGCWTCCADRRSRSSGPRWTPPGPTPRQRDRCLRLAARGRPGRAARRRPLRAARPDRRRSPMSAQARGPADRFRLDDEAGPVPRRELRARAAQAGCAVPADRPAVTAAAPSRSRPRPDRRWPPSCGCSRCRRSGWPRSAARAAGADELVLAAVVDTELLAVHTAVHDALAGPGARPGRGVPAGGLAAALRAGDGPGRRRVRRPAPGGARTGTDRGRRGGRLA